MLRRNSLTHCIVFLTLVLVLSSSLPAAMTNADFAAGLTGWDVAALDDFGLDITATFGGIPADLVYVNSNTAELLAPGDYNSAYTNVKSTVLSQTFSFDPGSDSLSFDVTMFGSFINETDAFTISLLDAAANPLIHYNGSAWFYYLDNGLVEYVALDVTATDPVVEIDPALNFSFSRNLSFDVLEEWIGDPVTLAFQLDHDYLDSTTVVRLGSITVDVSTLPTIPAPPALVLAAIAAVGVITARRNRKRSL